MTPDEVDALADRFFAAIERGDVEAVAAYYHPDVRVWHNYDQLDQEREANLAVLAWLGRHVEGLRYEDVRRDIVADGFVQQHVLRGATESGEPLEVPAMMRVTLRDGLIVRIEEYLDTAQTEALRTRRPR